MKTLKRFFRIAAVILLLVISLLILEKQIYENAVFSLPLYSSDGSVRYSDNTSIKENIRIIRDGKESRFQAVNADFSVRLTAGKRRLLLTEPKNCGDSITVYTNNLSINIYPGSEKELIIRYRYKNMPPVWFSLSGYGSYNTFLERAIGQMIEMEHLSDAGES